MMISTHPSVSFKFLDKLQPHYMEGYLSDTFILSIANGKRLAKPLRNRYEIWHSLTLPPNYVKGFFFSLTTFTKWWLSQPPHFLNTYGQIPQFSKNCH